MVPSRSITLHLRRTATSVLLLGLLSALVACERTPPQSSPATPDPAVLRFAKEQQEWRDQRREALTRADGWTALIGLHWVEPGGHYLGSAPDNGIRLVKGPAHLGMIELRDGALRLVPDKNAALTLDGQPLRAAAPLRADDHVEGVSKLGFDEGKGLATVIKRGHRYALRVKHADAPSRLGFTRLEYWPAQQSWQVAGRFLPHPPGKTLPIANIIGTIDATPNPGVVEFEHGGGAYRLEALDGGKGALFLVFADRTNGHGSYGAGRFIDVPAPTAQGEVVIDFNRAYNPPCAFTAYATCPLPPLENRLDLKVDAGEKSYHAAKAKVGS